MTENNQNRKKKGGRYAIKMHGWEKQSNENSMKMRD
jgi:hypothetical protein